MPRKKRTSKRQSTAAQRNASRHLWNNSTGQHVKPTDRRYYLRHRSIPHMFPAWPMSYQVMMAYQGNPDVIATEAR